jgi:hypothetical protein
MFVVDDLLANIDRGAVEIEGLFNSNDGTVNAGTISTRCG